MKNLRKMSWCPWTQGSKIATRSQIATGNGLLHKILQNKNREGEKVLIIVPSRRRCSVQCKDYRDTKESGTVRANSLYTRVVPRLQEAKQIESYCYLRSELSRSPIAEGIDETQETQLFGVLFGVFSSIFGASGQYWKMVAWYQY